MGGYPTDMKKINKVCKNKKIKIVEDASHALEQNIKMDLE